MEELEQPRAFEDISLQEGIKEDFIPVDVAKEQLEGHVDGMEGAQEYSEQSLVRPEDAFHLAQLGWKLEGRTSRQWSPGTRAQQSPYFGHHSGPRARWLG